MRAVAYAEMATVYAAASAVDPSWDVTEAEEQAAEAMSDAEWRARFAPVDDAPTQEVAA